MEHAEIHEQMGDLREDFHRLRSDLNSILHTMMDATRSEAGEAKEKLEAKAREQLDRSKHSPPAALPLPTRTVEFSPATVAARSINGL